MKKTIKIKQMMLAAIAAAITLCVVSCQKENNTAPTNTARHFTKQVTLTDPGGKNTVVLAITADDANLLERTDWTHLFSVAPIFEIPEENKEQADPENLQLTNSAEDVQVEILSKNLETGALGVSLGVAEPAGNGVSDRYEFTFTFTTDLDHIQVTAATGCNYTSYQWKVWSGGPWLICCGYTRCALSNSQFTSLGSYQTRAKISYNTGSTFHIVYW